MAQCPLRFMINETISNLILLILFLDGDVPLMECIYVHLFTSPEHPLMLVTSVVAGTVGIAGTVGMWKKYNVSLKKLLQQGVSEPELYGDLFYRFRKIVRKSKFRNNSESSLTITKE